jgi:hypothetical protein
MGIRKRISHNFCASFMESGSEFICDPFPKIIQNHCTLMQEASRRAARREAADRERQAAQRGWEPADRESQAAERDWEAVKLCKFSEQEASEWEAVQMAVLDMEMAEDGMATDGMTTDGTAMDSCVLRTLKTGDREATQRQCCESGRRFIPLLDPTQNLIENFYYLDLSWRRTVKALIINRKVVWYATSVIAEH